MQCVDILINTLYGNDQYIIWKLSLFHLEIIIILSGNHHYFIWKFQVSQLLQKLRTDLHLSFHSFLKEFVAQPNDGVTRIFFLNI